MDDQETEVKTLNTDYVQDSEQFGLSSDDWEKIQNCITQHKQKLIEDIRQICTRELREFQPLLTDEYAQAILDGCPLLSGPSPSPPKFNEHKRLRTISSHTDSPTDSGTETDTSEFQSRKVPREEPQDRENATTSDQRDSEPMRSAEQLAAPPHGYNPQSQSIKVPWPEPPQREHVQIKAVRHQYKESVESVEKPAALLISSPRDKSDDVCYPYLLRNFCNKYPGLPELRADGKITMSDICFPHNPHVQAHEIFSRIILETKTSTLCADINNDSDSYHTGLSKINRVIILILAHGNDMGHIVLSRTDDKNVYEHISNNDYISHLENIIQREGMHNVKFELIYAQCYSHINGGSKLRNVRVISLTKKTLKKEDQETKYLAAGHLAPEFNTHLQLDELCKIECAKY